MNKGCFGESYSEKWNLFLRQNNDHLPFEVENIGYTTPNPLYSISRKDEPVFVVEYIIGGHEYLNIDGKDFVLKVGDLCIIEPFTNHTYYSDKDDPVEKKWINFTSSIFDKILEEFSLKGKYVFDGNGTQKYLDELLLLSEKSRYNEDVCYDVASILMEILCQVKKNTMSFIDDYPSKIAKQTKDYLDGSIFKKTTLEDIARLTFYSKKQITREFKKYYKDTPYNYLINLKITMAERLLVVSNLSVKEIADRLCFDNQHYFSKAFKNKTGLSPLQYKKKNIG